MPSVHKVSIALTGEQLDSLKSVVETGEYATTSEVVREAIRDWQFKRESRQEDIRQLQHLWDEGVASGKSAPVNFTTFRVEARRRLRKLKKERASAR